MLTVSLRDFESVVYDGSLKICEVKVTSIEKYGFNSYEGYQYDIKVRLTMPDGLVFSDIKRPSKFAIIQTNSTYIEDMTDGKDADTSLKEQLQEYFDIAHNWELDTIRAKTLQK